MNKAVSFIRVHMHEEMHSNLAKRIFSCVHLKCNRKNNVSLIKRLKCLKRFKKTCNYIIFFF